MIDFLTQCVQVAKHIANDNGNRFTQYLPWQHAKNPAHRIFAVAADQSFTLRKNGDIYWPVGRTSKKDSFEIGRH